jgi:hypothetical protein
MTRLINTSLIAVLGFSKAGGAETFGLRDIESSSVTGCFEFQLS